MRVINWLQDMHINQKAFLLVQKARFEQAEASLRLRVDFNTQDKFECLFDRNRTVLCTLYKLFFFEYR